MPAQDQFTLVALRKDGPTQSSTHSDGTSGAIMPFRLPKPKCSACGGRHVKGVPCFGMVKAWDASKHPRGQPENKGEFGSSSAETPEKIAQTLTSPKALVALRDAMQSTHDDLLHGGCRVVAEAVHRVVPDSSIKAVVTNLSTHEKMVHHYVTQVGPDQYLDGGGLHSEADLIHDDQFGGGTLSNGVEANKLVDAAPLLDHPMNRGILASPEAVDKMVEHIKSGGSKPSAPLPSLHEPLSAIKPPSITDPLDIAQRTGGFSVSPTDNSQPTTGFMVATPGSTIVPHITDLTDPAQRSTVKAALIKYAKDNADHFASNPHLYIGGWHDTAHGEFVLDSSENVEDPTEAATLGAQRNQQSIWDVANQKEVKTGGTGDRESGASGKSESVQPSAGQRDGRTAGSVGGGSAEPGKPPSNTEPLPELIAPHNADTRTLKPLKGQTENREVTNTPNQHATTLAGLPADYQQKILDQIKTNSPTGPLTPEKLQQNLEKVWQSAQSDPIAMAAKDWYNVAGKAGADLPGMDERAGQAFMASLSPRTAWFHNVVEAQHMAKWLADDATLDLKPASVKEWTKKAKSAGVKIQNGKKLSEMAPNEAAWALLAMMKANKVTTPEMLTAKGKPSITALSGSVSVQKAVQIFRGEDPSAVLQGHKVRSFFNNMQDPDNKQGHDDVTVDTHMVSAAALSRIGATSGTIRKLFAASSSTPGNASGAYALFADAIRSVAKAHDLEPCQMQAILWTHWQTTGNLSDPNRHTGMRERKEFPDAV